MNKFKITIFLISSFSVVNAQISTSESSNQIISAIKAAPESEKEKCTVLGFVENGEVLILRKGENKTICIADDPAVAGFNVACYHQDLEPFMARGRTLKKEGRSFQEIFDIREDEVKSGKLFMPKNPTTLHIFSGKTEAEATYRWVVYIPYATAETTGLPTKPIIAGAPWIMDPGTHRAHIMISPPNE